MDEAGRDSIVESTRTPDVTAGPPVDTSVPVALREPANPVSERAIPYWRAKAIIGGLVGLAIFATAWVLVLLFASGHLWWVSIVIALLVAAEIAEVIYMPRLRYRVHRWEVTPTAVHTRAGWLTRNERIAPLSRVQTVDSTQGPLMRAYGLGSITVTTASAAGPITIEALDFEVARQVVAELTEVTGRDAGDAT